MGWWVVRGIYRHQLLVKPIGPEIHRSLDDHVHDGEEWWSLGLIGEVFTVLLYTHDSSWLSDWLFMIGSPHAREELPISRASQDEKANYWATLLAAEGTGRVCENLLKRLTLKRCKLPMAAFLFMYQYLSVPFVRRWPEVAVLCRSGKELWGKGPAPQWHG